MSMENQNQSQPVSQEWTARTVEEAIQVGLAELGVGLDEVEVDVLDRGRQGILGVGASRARVRLTLLSGRRPLEEEEDDSLPQPGNKLSDDSPAIARNALLDLLAKMGVDADVFVTSREGDSPIALDVRGEDAGILIGRQGRTLTDLQVMVNVLVSRQVQERTPITVDVEGYKERRFEKVRRIALRAADRARRSGRAVILEPMSPAERRVVHMALADNRAVTTQSEGVGPTRHVVISPTRQAPPPRQYGGGPRQSSSPRPRR